MGLLSFLTRKRAVDDAHQRRAPSDPTTLAQAAAAAPGDAGPPPPEPPRRPPPGRASQSQLSSPVKPFFLGIRGGDDRPDSAPAAHPALPPPQSSPGPWAFQFPLRPRASVGPSRRTRLADVPEPARPPTVYSLADGSARYVDILDARSEIRPYCFKDRVQAAGTRDYGEDVAERNLGQNAVDLNSPAVRAFYASAAQPGPRPLRPDRALALGLRNPSLARSVVSIAAFARPDDRPDDRAPDRSNSVSALAPDGLVVKKRQPRASRPDTLDPTQLLAGFESISDRGRRSRRRAGASPIRKGKQRQPYEPAPIRPRHDDRRNLARDHLRPRTAAAKSRSNHRSASPPYIPRYRPSSLQPSPVSRNRRSAGRAERPRSEAFDIDLDDRILAPLHMRSPDKSPRLLAPPAPRRREKRGGQEPRPEVGDSDEESPAVYASSPAAISGHRHDGSPLPGLARPGDHIQWTSPWVAHHRDAAASRLVSSGRRSGGAHSRNGSRRSSASAHALATEFAGHVPDRKSSLKQWSISSVTPTTEMSDHSSNPAARPRSTHTANTSIDLPQLPGLPQLSEPKGAAAAAGGGSSSSHGRPCSSPYLTAQEDGAHTDSTGASPPALGRGGRRDGQRDRRSFHMEDWACVTTDDESDADSFAEKRRRQRRQDADDESLLFRQGSYGDLGRDLPGLHDDGPERAPCLMCSLLESVADDYAPAAGGLALCGQRAAPCGHGALVSTRDRLRALGYDYDTDDSASEPEMALRGTIEAPSLRRPSGGASAASGGVRRRASSYGVDDKTYREPRPRGHGRSRNRACEPVPEDYEEGHAADVE